MAPRSLELLFLHLTPRLYILRTVIISSLLIVSINIQWLIWLNSPPTLWIVLFAVIPVHHILSSFKLKFFYGAMDFLLLVVEVIGAGKYARTLRIRSWIPETLVFHIVLAWIIVASLSITITFRIATAIRLKGKSLILPFDILGDHPPTNRETSPFHLLFGRSIWRQNFVGENASVRGIRGVMAIITLAGILFFVLLDIIFAPIKETALSPVKEFRIPGVTPYDMLDDIETPVWNVIYPLGLQLPDDESVKDLTTIMSSDVYFSAVSVTPIWPESISADLTSDCVKTIKPYTSSGPVYVIRCEAALFDDASFYLPDLNINVDFGPLTPGLSSLKSFSTRMNLPLVISLVNDTTDALTRTMPTAFIPGTNMIASSTVDVRQIYSKPALAALGIFEITETFWAPRFINFYPDPEPTFVGKNLSSLSIFSQDNYGELRVTQDYREKSVMAGFASVGGLWTAFSGIFTIIFGASMLHTLYGNKPLSIFGIAHSFQSDEMKQECLRLYPNILDEHYDDEKRGLLSLLRDHLIDLSFLDEKHNPRNATQDEEKRPDIEAAPPAVDPPVLQLDAGTVSRPTSSSAQVEEKITLSDSA